MKGKDIMSAPVLTVTPETPVRDAIQVMLGNHVSGLPVVDAAGRLVGVITEADLLFKEVEPKPATPVVEWVGPWLWLERWASTHRKAEGRTVGEVMTHNVVTADEETPVHDLAARMVRHQINRLPIVRGREVVGIVTRADVLRVFLRSDEEVAGEAQRIAGDYIRPLEDVRISVQRGVLKLRGKVASPARRAGLLAALEAMDGLVAIDDTDLEHGIPESALIGGE